MAFREILAEAFIAADAARGLKMRVEALAAHFSNPCNTCCVNAPLQRLPRCPAARAALSGQGGEGEPLVARRTGRSCAPRRPPARGAPLPAEGVGGEVPAPARVGRWRPRAILGAFLAMRGLQSGGAGASEALSFSLGDGPGPRLVSQTGWGAEVAMRPPSFAGGADEGDGATSPRIPLRCGARRNLTREGRCAAAPPWAGGRLRAKPESLATRAPRRLERGDGSALSLAGCDVAPEWGEQRAEVVLKERGCKPVEVLRHARKPKSKGNNADVSRQDAQNHSAALAPRSSRGAKSSQAACEARRDCGDLFLLLHLLELLAAAGDLLNHCPETVVYAGDDCANRWATMLRAPDRPNKFAGRLRGALWVTEGGIFDAERRLESGELHMRRVAELLDERLNSVRGARSAVAAVRLAVGDWPGGQGDGRPPRARLAEAADAAASAVCAQAACQARKPRAFQTCACCAAQQRSEKLHSEFLAGDRCTKGRAQCAECLSPQRHHRRRPLMPRVELASSAVDFPRDNCGGSPTSSKILLHKRRAPPEAPEGKLLRAFGRVAFAKIHLSSKGADAAARQGPWQGQQSWRQKFLLHGMQGTAATFGNGSAFHATRSFPPEPDVLRDTFVAVFAGVPDCALACAKSVPAGKALDDVAPARGPASATAGAQAETSARACLRMEGRAGRAATNPRMSRLEDQRGEDTFKLRWRAQALETNNCQAWAGAGDMAKPAEVAWIPAKDDPRFLQLPTNGDEDPPKQVEGRLCCSVTHLIKNLFSREGMEYDVPADDERYVVSPISRFRSSYYGVHLLCSLILEVTGATDSACTFMKTDERFGPPSHFVTPNLADTRQPLILTVQEEEYTFDNDLTEAEEVTFSEMSQRIAAVAVGQGKLERLRLVTNGMAADLMGAPAAFGPLAAALGLVEAQGGGSLHLRILVRLLQDQLRVLLDVLQRDEARFQERLNLWMPQAAQRRIAAPPPPFGPNEKLRFSADGGAEMATAEQFGVEGEMGPQEFWLYDGETVGAAAGAPAGPLPSDERIGENCRDARELVIGCGIHHCSPSCYKYHSDKKFGSKIGRRFFYNAKDSTKCAAVVSARCTVDAQDMRRVLPPRPWTEGSELEPPANEGGRKSYNHSLYPQRYSDLSVGACEDWGWFQHLNTASAEKWDLVAVADSLEISRELAICDSLAVDGDDAALAKLQRDLERRALATFVGAHNASCRVISRVAKGGPSMGDVPCTLLDGALRPNSQRGDRGAQAEGDAGDEAQSTAAGKRRRDFKRALPVLTRFETCFRRASWKGGCEIVFPMLVGRLSCMAHRCWMVFARKSTHLAAVSRRSTGQRAATLGRRQLQREGAAARVSPDVEEFDAIEYAHHAFQIASASGGSLRDATKIQGRSAEPARRLDAPRDHPIVRDMSTCIYCILVHRAELQMHVRPARELGPEGSGGRARHVDIAFDSSHSAARNWIQGLAAEPRAPEPDGFQFASAESSAEAHHLMKSPLLRPVHLPDPGGPSDTKESGAAVGRSSERDAAASSPRGGQEHAPDRADSEGRPSTRGSPEFLRATCGNNSFACHSTR
ncbi:unnamed protein product [Prorocentrum cordatum]|uniref:Uncharacterized protein n=1 Tax=Prorocentrum cordatum TaxID=2364126 RepID=A0ABN9UU45_9DINO|nr:unnamed protein product [Polarella glacialis]